MRFKSFSRMRFFFQLAATIVSNGYIPGWLRKPHLYDGVIKGATPPILNCYACPGAYTSCPIGSIQHFAVIKAMPYYVLGILIVVGVAVGRLFCGWACPFGFFQDLLFKIKTKKLTMPRWLRFGKYLFLIATVFLVPYLIGDTVFCKICPDGALIGGIPQMLLNKELHHLAGVLFWIKVSILILIIVASILIKRIFCRAICPLGAFLAIFNKISFLQIHTDASKCSKCNMCRKICPVDINVCAEPNSPECIRCGLCTTTCAKGAVRFSTIFSPSRIQIENPECNL